MIKRCARIKGVIICGYEGLDTELQLCETKYGKAYRVVDGERILSEEDTENSAINHAQWLLDKMGE